MLKLQILKSAFSPKNSNVALSLHTAGKQIEKRVFKKKLNIIYKIYGIDSNIFKILNSFLRKSGYKISI